MEWRSDDKTVRLWDMQHHRLVCWASVPAEARSAAFSCDGNHVAVGLKNGQFVVLSSADLSLVGRVVPCLARVVACGVMI